jgi:hypothetical protein
MGTISVYYYIPNIYHNTNNNTAVFIHVLLARDIFFACLQNVELDPLVSFPAISMGYCFVPRWLQPDQSLTESRHPAKGMRGVPIPNQQHCNNVNDVD